MSDQSTHLKFIKVLLDQPVNLLQRDQRLSENTVRGISEFWDGYDCRIVKVKEEYAYLNGTKTLLYRIFIHSPTSGPYESTGWILPLEVDCCMICYKAFGFFTYKHSCRGCGNIVCNECSPNTAIVAELEKCGPQWVCELRSHAHGQMLHVIVDSDVALLTKELDDRKAEVWS